MALAKANRYTFNSRTLLAVFCISFLQGLSWGKLKLVYFFFFVLRPTSHVPRYFSRSNKNGC